MDGAARLRRLISTAALTFLLLILCRPFMAGRIMRRGDGYLGHRMFEDAVRQYRKAVFFDPARSEIRDWLGYTYDNMGRTDEAVEVYEDAVEVDAQDMAARHGLGMIYLRKGEFERAMGYFLEASRITYDRKRMTKSDYEFYHSTSLDMLAFSQARLGDIEGAMETCGEILKYYPEDTPLKRRVETRMAELQKEWQIGP